MKKYIVFIFFLFSLINGLCQETKASGYPDSGYLAIGRTWVEKKWNNRTGIEPYYVTRTIVGETTLYGKTVKIELRVDHETGHVWTAYMYEENGVVYKSWDRNVDRFYPILNYNVAVGDRLPIKIMDYIDPEDEIIGYYTVEEVYYDIIEGLERKIIKLSHEFGDGLLTWIEGVWEDCSILALYVPPCIDLSCIMSVYDGDTCIFSYDDYFKTDETKIIKEDRWIDNSFYDLMGNRIKHPRKDNIYTQW